MCINTALKFSMYLVNNSKSSLDWCHFLKRHPPWDHLPKKQTKTVDIDLPAVRAVSYHLGRHPAVCARVLLTNLLTQPLLAWDAKVGYLDIHAGRVSTAVKEDVLWLKVTVHHPLRVDVLHPTCHTESDQDQFWEGEWCMVLLVKEAA